MNDFLGVERVKVYEQDRPDHWLRENPHEAWRADIYCSDHSHHHGVGHTDAEALFNACLAFIKWRNT